MDNPFVWLNTELLGLIARFLENHGAAPAVADLAARAIGLVWLLVLAYAVNYVAKRFILRVLNAFIARTRFRWDKAFQEAKVFTRLSHIAPAVVIQAFGPAVLGDSHTAQTLLQAALSVYLIVIILLVLGAVLDAIHDIWNDTEAGQNIPLKGFVQAGKLLGVIIGGILILSVAIGESPVYFLSGIGALTAVFLLVFRDVLLGFVAGVMISANQMVRVGDWIEMPAAGADGDVMDVSLTTVKVRNWDRTITTIPSYDLISKSFKNWRGMKDSGGRRIKRAINIDLQTLRFADADMLARWQRIHRLQGYLKEKLSEVDAANKKNDKDFDVLCNGRRLTNIGTFRAYCVAYLREHPEVRQDMTFLVRQLAPAEHGLPLEIYVFSSDIRWPYYEAIQSDIFDHLLSVLSDFGLRIFQQPSGNDVRALLGEDRALDKDRTQQTDEAAAVMQHEGIPKPGSNRAE